MKNPAKRVLARPCDAIGCATRTQMGRFLCLPHWRMVPVPTQDTVNVRFRACRKDNAFLSDLAYLQACVDAIEGIARAEGKEAVQTSYHRLLAIARRKASA